MLLALISNQEQYQALFGGGFSGAEDLTILCDNPAFYDFLKDEKVDFIPLGEEHLRESWKSINSWACEKALFWGRFAGEGSFHGVALDKALYVFFSYYLVAFLKNYLLAEYVFREFSPDGIVVFDGVFCPDFPRFNGNYFLNLFLKNRAEQAGIKVIRMRSVEKRRVGKDGPVKGRLRGVAQSVYSMLTSTKGGADTYVARGSLKHLDPVISEIRGRGEEIFLYDLSFHAEQLKYCLEKKIGYFIPGSFLKKAPKKNGFDYEKDFFETVEKLRANRWFVYGDADISWAVCGELINRTKRYLRDISLWSRAYDNIMRRFKVKGVITDDDWTWWGGFMAAFFASRGVESFCVSHGYGAHRFSLDGSMRTFALSETFVHSEYEKSLYHTKGWDKDNLHVTGVPRYDRLAGLGRGNAVIGKGKKKMRIMCCSNTIHDYSPDKFSYIGVSQFTPGRYMKACVRDLIEAAEGYDIDIIVRPHHPHDEQLWVDFIEKNKKTNKVHLSSAKLDFFEVLSRCDAMFVGYWSTAIIESVILGIPAVVIDYSGTEPGHPFAEEGLCSVARDISELRSKVEELYGLFISQGGFAGNTAVMGGSGFYTGTNDGGNTLRVVDSIFMKAERDILRK